MMTLSDPIKNQIIQYIHFEPNHPPNINKQIPKQSKKASSSSSAIKKYSMNQHLSMKINCTSVTTNKNYITNLVNTKIHNKRNRKRSLI